MDTNGCLHQTECNKGSLPIYFHALRIYILKAYEISQKRRQLESLAQHMINANANNTQNPQVTTPIISKLDLTVGYNHTGHWI